MTLQAVRKQNRWRLTLVSSYLNIAPSTLSRIERGLQAPRVPLARKIAKLYGMSLDDVYKHFDVERRA
jgi:transcriptional regulator with XRE-family HTH domain